MTTYQLSKHKLRVVGFTGSVIQAIMWELIPFLARVGIKPLWLTLLMYPFALGIGLCIATGAYTWAAFFILANAALDLTDGHLARYIRAPSRRGALLDAMADFSTLMAMYVGLYIAFESPMVFAIVVMTAYELFIRFILKLPDRTQGVSAVENARSSIDSGNLVTRKLRRTVRAINLFMNYFDLTCSLAFVLLLRPKFWWYWLCFALFQAAFLLLTRLVQYFKEIIKAPSSAS